MKFSVVWTQEAKNQLAETWLNAADRAAVTAAADRIDEFLRQNPDSVGMPYDDHTLILVVRALAVRYTYRPLDVLVSVVALRTLRPNPPGSPG